MSRAVGAPGPRGTLWNSQSLILPQGAGVCNPLCSLEPNPSPSCWPLSPRAALSVGQAASHHPLPEKSIREILELSGKAFPPNRRGHARAPSLPWMLYSSLPGSPGVPSPRHSRLKGTSSKAQFPADPAAGDENGSLSPRVCFSSSLIAWKAFLGCSGKQQSVLWATAKTLSHSKTKCQLKPTTSTSEPPSPSPSPHAGEKGCPGVKLL